MQQWTLPLQNEITTRAKSGPRGGRGGRLWLIQEWSVVLYSGRLQYESNLLLVVCFGDESQDWVRGGVTTGPMGQLDPRQQVHLLIHASAKLCVCVCVMQLVCDPLMLFWWCYWKEGYVLYCFIVILLIFSWLLHNMEVSNLKRWWYLWYYRIFNMLKGFHGSVLHLFQSCYELVATLSSC